MLSWFQRVLRSESGQGMAEYALILVLVAVLCLATIKTLGSNIKGRLNYAATQINSATD